MHRNIEEVLLSQQQIAQRVAELGQELSREYKGVVVFYADMIRAITVPCQLDFMCISSYSGTESTGKMVVKKDVSVDVKGRHVVILEDILDTGNSLDYTYRHLLSKEPASLKICTLLDKPERRKEGITLKPDYVGFTIPNKFVVGYGLDFDEHYRNLPYVGVLKPEAYENKG